MRSLISIKILLIVLLALGCYSGAAAQDVRSETEGGAATGQRGNILRELGLTPEQVRKVRQANQARRPELVAAQKRYRGASQALDAAVYGDVLDERQIESLLTELQLAQSELIKVRLDSELSIRKILNAEQLTRFREMRANFALSREGMQMRKQQRFEQMKERRMRRESQREPRQNFKKP